ncbi:MAG TPA: hypothetical protein DD629_06175 [Treponema sp.]|nr:hypothetical protein [Treponema sp.]
MESLNLVLCSDNNFILPSLVTINSVLQHNSDSFFSVFIVTTGLSQKNIETIEDFSKQRNKQAKIEIITANKDILKDCPIKKGDHVSLSAYLRIFLPSILPKNINKILYLDGDILCVSSILDFYNAAIQSKSCSAVIDERNNDEEIFNRLEYPKDCGYFNSGVILINLEYWRKNDFQNKTLNYIFSNKEKCLWHDQDALNVTLAGTVDFADFKYNLTQPFLFDKNQLKIDSKYYPKIDSAIKTPCLIHYCATYKPWHIECNSPFKKLWRQSYKKTFKKNCRLQFKNKGAERIKWCIKLILNTLKIKKYADFRKSIIGIEK